MIHGDTESKKELWDLVRQRHPLFEWGIG